MLLKELLLLKNKGEERWLPCVIFPRSTTAIRGVVGRDGGGGWGVGGVPTQTVTPLVVKTKEN